MMIGEVIKLKCLDYNFMSQLLMSFFDLLFQMLCWFILIGTPFWPIILHLASCLLACIYACLSTSRTEHLPEDLLPLQFLLHNSIC